ncbi:replication protein A 70 kDa DNA-binding subunit B, partial [Tanacetum coccineum]
VIGTIVSISNLIPFESYGKEKKKRNVILQDVDGRQLECCFYEGWAEKFNDYANQNETTGPVTKLQSAIVCFPLNFTSMKIYQRLWHSNRGSGSLPSQPIANPKKVMCKGYSLPEACFPIMDLKFLLSKEKENEPEGDEG